MSINDGPLELKHVGGSTPADLQTLDFPARSEFLLAANQKLPWMLKIPTGPGSLDVAGPDGESSS